MAKVTIWFDGSCPLCAREIALMRRLDWRRAVSFIDIAAEDSLCPMDRHAMLERIRAREDDGPVISGAAAFAALWRALPLLRPLGLAARSRLILSVLERCYLGFLRLRPASPALLKSRTKSPA